MVPELKNLTHEERLKEMQLNTLEERKERRNLIAIYKFMNNMEKIDRKYFILRRKEGAENLRGHKKKLQKGIFLDLYKKVYFFPREV